MGWARARAIALVALVLVGLLAATHPGRVAVKSVLLLPEAFSAVPVRPLAWITPQPRRETFLFDYSVGVVEGDLYAPSVAGRHGALVLILGARPLDRDDPILVRFAEGLSRAGALVMIPASSTLAEGRVLPEEVDAIARSVAFLEERDDVDPGRIGILGFSVGGSVAVLAAADPRLADRLAFVNTFGGYNDARDLLRAVATRSLVYAGLDVVWVPHNLTVWVVAKQIVDTLPEGTDRDILGRLFLEEDPAAREDVDALSPTGRAMLALLDGLPPAEAEEALALLPEASRERLRRISPSLVLEQVHTPLFVMHDVADRFIPYTESRRLVERMPPGAVERFTEFELFDHVVPDRGLDAGLVVELAKLYRQMYEILLRVL
jgi:pimeloyl-ACP methyl ester carboxylesterase